MDKYEMVPALRFPEFTDRWSRELFREIVEVKSAKYNPLRGNAVIKCIELEHLSSDSGQLLGYSDGLHSASIKNVFNKGDVLFGKLRPYLRKYLLAPFDGVCSSEIWVLKTKRGLNSFLYYLVQTDAFIDLTGISSGSKMPRADWDVVSQGVFFHPSLPEQQKIASCLTSFDKKIQQLSRKKNLLEQYKKGVMQQLFSQKLRFKDDEGDAYPDWERTEFGDLVDFISTNSLSRSQLNYEEGTIKNVHYGDIHTKFNARFIVSMENVPFINTDVDLSRTPESSYCRVGDLIIADASEDYKDVGKAIEVVATGNQKLLAGLHTFIARNKNDDQLAPSFKAYLMQSPAVRRQIMTYAVGISVLSISKINLGKVKVDLPHYAEQNKIATFLAAIDDKINAVNQQIELNRQFKKGLLQQMFV